MDFYFLEDYWHTNIYSENEFYEIMNIMEVNMKIIFMHILIMIDSM